VSDRLALANAIEDAGIERGKAQRLASVIFDAIHDNVATKADLERVQAAFRTDINRVEYSLKAEITRMRDWLALRGLAALVSGLGVLFAALHYWPPGHG
jgi:hypothetical protein